MNLRLRLEAGKRRRNCVIKEENGEDTKKDFSLLLEGTEEYAYVNEIEKRRNRKTVTTPSLISSRQEGRSRATTTKRQMRERGGETTRQLSLTHRYRLSEYHYVTRSKNGTTHQVRSSDWHILKSISPLLLSGPSVLLLGKACIMLI